MTALAWQGDFLEAFSQDNEEQPACCTTSTIRCYYPEDFLNCYPWPEALKVTDRVLHTIKCAPRADFQRDGNDLCVVVGDQAPEISISAAISAAISASRRGD